MIDVAAPNEETNAGWREVRAVFEHTRDLATVFRLKGDGPWEAGCPGHDSVAHQYWYTSRPLSTLAGGCWAIAIAGAARSATASSPFPMVAHARAFRRCFGQIPDRPAARMPFGSSESLIVSWTRSSA